MKRTLKSSQRYRNYYEAKTARYTKDRPTAWIVIPTNRGSAFDLVCLTS